MGIDTGPKQGDDDWKKFSWDKLKKQVLDLPRAAGKEISALVRGEKTYKIVDAAAVSKAKDKQQIEKIRSRLGLAPEGIGRPEPGRPFVPPPVPRAEPRRPAIDVRPAQPLRVPTLDVQKPNGVHLRQVDGKIAAAQQKIAALERDLNTTSDSDRRMNLHDRIQNTKDSIEILRASKRRMGGSQQEAGL